MMKMQGDSMQFPSPPLAGLENKLGDLEELFDIPGKYRCSYVGARMDRALIGNIDHYQQFTEVPHEPFITTGMYFRRYLHSQNVLYYIENCRGMQDSVTIWCIDLPKIV